MKLDEYVKRTLLDITKGVTEAQKVSQLHIAPGFVENEAIITPQMVAFEIAVTVNKEAGGGINVWSIGDVKAQGSSERTNRISFEVPVYFQSPTEQNERHYTRRDKKQLRENQNDHHHQKRHHRHRRPHL